MNNSDPLSPLHTLPVDHLPLCIHISASTLKGLGIDLETWAQHFLQRGCTLLIPTQSWSFMDPKQSPRRIPTLQSQWRFDKIQSAQEIFQPSSLVVDPEMGYAAEWILRQPGAVRSNHPTNSFAALGPLAQELCGNTSGAYDPLERLAAAGGWILQWGVRKMTWLHGIRHHLHQGQVIRWVRQDSGDLAWLYGGACAKSFGRVYPHLEDLAQRIEYNKFIVTAYKASQVAERVETLLREQNVDLHCTLGECELCDESRQCPPLVDEEQEPWIYRAKLLAGEDLWGMAQRLDLDPWALKWINQWSEDEPAMEGSWLRILGAENQGPNKSWLWEGFAEESRGLWQQYRPFKSDQNAWSFAQENGLDFGALISQMQTEAKEYQAGDWIPIAGLLLAPPFRREIFVDLNSEPWTLRKTLEEGQMPLDFCQKWHLDPGALLHINGIRPDQFPPPWYHWRILGAEVDELQRPLKIPHPLQKDKCLALVRRTQSLTEFAQELKVSPETLLAMNPDKNENLWAGQIWECPWDEHCTRN